MAEGSRRPSGFVCLEGAEVESHAVIGGAAKTDRQHAMRVTLGEEVELLCGRSGLSLAAPNAELQVGKIDALGILVLNSD